MRATWIHTLLLVAAAAAAAGAFALAAASHGGSETAPALLKMPAETGNRVVDVRPAQGRTESSPAPVVRAPATPVETAKSAKAAPGPRTLPRLRSRPRVTVVTVPRVVLTRAEPVRPRLQLVRAKPKRPAPVTRELAAVPEPEAEPMHDNRPRPHE